LTNKIINFRVIEGDCLYHFRLYRILRNRPKALNSDSQIQIMI